MNCGSWRRPCIALVACSLWSLATAAQDLAPAEASGDPVPAQPEPSGQAGEDVAGEVVVRVHREEELLRASAEVVQVIDTRAAQRRAADLGETLARAAGVTVQRAGGLGSDTRLSLNGLEGDQIRFFVDGVPLGYAGFSFGLANVPLNLVRRIEVYRGVVPARFGADALGGAINLVSEEASWQPRLAGSYQAGSFDTHRVTLDASRVLDPDGLFVRANLFADSTDNDYPVDVEVVDASGQQTPARVYRFHDDYRAAGIGVEGGWLGRLTLRAFATASSKQVQHDSFMVEPYGAVTTRTRSAGAHVRYHAPLPDFLELSAVAGYALGRTGFRDLSSCIYDWFGQCIRQRVSPGEVENVARDNVIDNHAAYARVNLTWYITPEHRLRLALSPELIIRTGDERRPRTQSGVDALEAERLLMSHVTGVEYQLDALAGRLENIVALKSYLQFVRSEQPLPTGGAEPKDRDSHDLGVGNALRYRWTEGLSTKASYEYATRLPQPDEVFGDGALTEENLDLSPETSHNANVGLSVESGDTPTGALSAELNLFYRDARDLIRRVGSAVFFSYQNVASARTLGGDVTLTWTSPHEIVRLEASGTLQDSRNTSSSGPYAAQRGDRIPNRPYAFGSASLELRYPGLIRSGDSVSASWSSRYVHSFYRTWESLGSLELKPRVDSQLVHAVGLSYAIEAEERAISTTVEMQNVADARVYDFFGVQRPGRAVFFKTTVEL